MSSYSTDFNVHSTLAINERKNGIT
jgi:hypothetical protein